jgi:hypothetical protein
LQHGLIHELTETMGGSPAMMLFFMISVGASLAIGGYAVVGLWLQKLYINGAAASLWLERLSITKMSPGCRTGDRCCSTQLRNNCPVNAG